MKNFKNLSKHCSAKVYNTFAQSAPGHLRFCILMLMLAVIAACEKSPERDSLNGAGETVALKKTIPEFPTAPGSFITGITNPYVAFTPGKIFHYRGETDEGVETTVVEVTPLTETILDVTVTVIHDQVKLNDTLIEDTFDWLAQDTDGNVWYFGEDTKEYENGVVVSTEGSWRAGENGATPGIFMLAQPESGMKYQQEFAEGVAEDMAKILNLNRTVNIEMGTFTGCLEILEWTHLNPGVYEHKFYKPGIGMVLEVHPQGGMETSELVRVE